MSKAETKEEFEKAWKQHVQTLSLLGFSLPLETIGELKEIIKKLNELIDLAIKETYEKVN